MKTKPKAILFDLDNTLVNTHAILNQYLINITKKYFKITPKEEHILETETVEQVLEWIKKHGIKIRPWTKITILIHFLFTDLKKIKKFKEVDNLLETLKKENIKLGIISNGPKIYVNKVLRNNEIKNYFQTIQTSSNNKPKPSNEMIIKASKKLGVKPEECIVVDDGIGGIEAGIKSKCKTIYFSKDKKTKSTYYAKDLNEVKKIIKNIIQ